MQRLSPQPEPRLNHTQLRSTIRLEDIQQAQGMQRQQEEEEAEETTQHTYLPPLSSFSLRGPELESLAQFYASPSDLQNLRESLARAHDDHLLALQILLRLEFERRDSVNSFASETDSQRETPLLSSIQTIDDGGTPLFPDPEYDREFANFLASLPVDALGFQLAQSDFHPVGLWDRLEALDRWDRDPDRAAKRRRRGPGLGTPWATWTPWTMDGFHTVVNDGLLVAFVRLVGDEEDDEEKRRRWKKGWRWMYQIRTCDVVGLFRRPIIGPHWIYGSCEG